MRPHHVLNRGCTLRTAEHRGDQVLAMAKARVVRAEQRDQAESTTGTTHVQCSARTARSQTRVVEAGWSRIAQSIIRRGHDLLGLRMEEDLHLPADDVIAADLVAAVLDLQAAEGPTLVLQLALELGLRFPFVFRDRVAFFGVLRTRGAAGAKTEEGDEQLPFHVGSFRAGKMGHMPDQTSAPLRRRS